MKSQDTYYTVSPHGFYFFIFFLGSQNMSLLRFSGTIKTYLLPINSFNPLTSKTSFLEEALCLDANYYSGHFFLI